MEEVEGMHISEIAAAVALDYILYLVLFLAADLERNFDDVLREVAYEDRGEVVGSLSQKMRS